MHTLHLPTSHRGLEVVVFNHAPTPWLFRPLESIIYVQTSQSIVKKSNGDAIDGYGRTVSVELMKLKPRNDVWWKVAGRRGRTLLIGAKTYRVVRSRRKEVTQAGLFDGPFDGPFDDTGGDRQLWAKIPQDRRRRFGASLDRLRRMYEQAGNVASSAASWTGHAWESLEMGNLDRDQVTGMGTALSAWPSVDETSFYDMYKTAAATVVAPLIANLAAPTAVTAQRACCALRGRVKDPWLRNLRQHLRAARRLVSELHRLYFEAEQKAAAWSSWTRE
ncbi:hypothetical protein CcaCcLH18_13089 [Colletotrichum camelliae]|nr:hypothetical protein CcaCcLH18_13089 [Colletotrichum camelliae]